MALTPRPGDADLERAADSLARRLPEPLRPLAAVAYDLRWSWTPGGAEVFAAIDPERWDLVDHNPVRQLVEAAPERLDEVAADPTHQEELARLLAALAVGAAPAPTAPPPAGGGPVAFLCAEVGVHESLPVYSGGLGVLAGDILKEASDLGLPMVAVTLLYRNGYFHQRVDGEGRQQAHWTDVDPSLLPLALVHDGEGQPVKVAVPIDGRDVVVQIWRAAVGHVPLYLLDADVAENDRAARWTTARLYDGTPEVRLAQYAVLGMGGARALDALGLEPTVLHVNEGHPILATAELLGRHELGADLHALPERIVFTTHTPVPAGNETYPAELAERVLANVAERTGAGPDYLAAGRLDPADPDAPVGMTPLALRAADSTNAVSERHGGVSRSMWRGLFPDAADDDEVPITHVTNGVHLPTWVSDAVAACLDRHLGPAWRTAADDPGTWRAIDEVPAGELWAARNEARARLVEVVHRRAVDERLRRGDGREAAEAVLAGFAPDRLTIGFARRIATYKRLHLLAEEPERTGALLARPDGMQLVLAGKAHPSDGAGQAVLQRVFEARQRPEVGARVAFLEDYDLAVARDLVAGCDVWLNVPRPPQEASGTSGMKAAANGCLNLSVLDGWWSEGWSPEVGWALDGAVVDDHEAQDRQHASAVVDLLEREVLPRFYERDADGVPQGWIAMVRADLRQLAPRFSATRMVRDYATRLYPEV